MFVIVVVVFWKDKKENSKKTKTKKTKPPTKPKSSRILLRSVSHHFFQPTAQILQGFWKACSPKPLRNYARPQHAQFSPILRKRRNQKEQKGIRTIPSAIALCILHPVLTIDTALPNHQRKHFLIDCILLRLRPSVSSSQQIHQRKSPLRNFQHRFVSDTKQRKISQAQADHQVRSYPKTIRFLEEAALSLTFSLANFAAISLTLAPSISVKQKNWFFVVRTSFLDHNRFLPSVSRRPSAVYTPSSASHCRPLFHHYNHFLSSLDLDARLRDHLISPTNHSVNRYHPNHCRILDFDFLAPSTTPPAPFCYNSRTSSGFRQGSLGYKPATTDRTANRVSQYLS